MSNICNGCAAPEDKQNKPGLICGACTGFTHLCCLSGQGTPGELAGDVFFDYTCLNCSKDKRELFTRTRLQWVNVVYLTLYYFNIHWYGISNRGFFHYKTHVCSFIDRHWNELFEPKFKQKKNWIGTIAGVLSIYNNTIFRSGSTVLGETGWWRLQHAFSPAVAAHILQEVSRDKEKHKGRAKSHVAMEKNLFFDKVMELGYKDLLADGNEARRPPSIEPAPKKRRVDSDELSCVSTSTYSEHVDPDIKTEAPEDVTLDYLSTSLLKDGGYSDAEATFRGFDFPPVNVIPPSDSSSLHSHQHSQNYDSDTGSSSHPQHDASDENDEKHAARKPDAKSKRSAEDRAKDLKRDSLFSVQLNSVTMPWLPEKPPEVNKELVEMTEYEEVQLLKQVEGLIPKVRDANRKAALRRFRAGLALRRLKRHKHLPIFDLDTSMKVLGGYITEDAKVVTNTERVLDRFQRNYLLANLCGTVHSGGAATLLAGGVPAPLRSPYSGAQLKPYIRRDTAARPLWLRLTDELLLKANRKNPSFVLPARAALEYSYVRPHHIAAVNWLCAQHFWPGVDLTESLQYPEYSCVVTHRRLVVGCAFLVPDVARTEAYISFILTRPEWRGAGIGTFMLYHLLQTCTGKDVTLHVSPTNPAIFLYQKFGFKVEELIQDFYEKYYDIDFKGCRHALFLRLTR